MESLAYLVAFILACVVIGGPAALALTYIRPYRRSYSLAVSAIAFLLGTVSTFMGSVLLLSEGAIISKALGLIGVITGGLAVVRSFRKIRDHFLR